MRARLVWTEQTAGMADAYDPGGLEPARAPAGPMAERVADADRDTMITLLREHVVDGRLTLDEFSERVGLALQARTRGELEVVLSDLPTVATPQDEKVRRSPRRWFVGVMSGASAKGRWRIGGSTTAVAVMGGVEMDLRKAEIDGAEIVISAFAFMGGIEIVVPEGIDVEMTGFAFMGGRDLKLRDVPIVPGSPRITIRAFAFMGGIDIKSKPNRTGKEIGQTIVDHVLGAVESMPSLGGLGNTPLDLDALRRDLREQLKAQRSAVRDISRDARRDFGHDPRWDDRRGRRRDVDRPVETEAVPAEPLLPRSNEGTVTILFSDMVDYAGMTERLGDDASRQLLRQHHEIVREQFENHGGREVKVQGDGFMVAFGGVARALRCAAEIQRAFRAHAEDHPDQPIRVHMGIHTGEAMEEDDDFLGHTVIVASRLASVAAPEEILVSSLSAQLVERTEEFRFENYREATLKGLARPQQVTTLVWGD
jgi:class 3 adenylate cyclase